jgi:hypothetical protein
MFLISCAASVMVPGPYSPVRRPAVMETSISW